MEITIRAGLREDDRSFMRKLNARLVEVIEAPTHSADDITAFQDDFTATAWGAEPEKNETFIASDERGQRLGYVNVRESTDEITNEKCAYIALLAIIPEAEGKGVAQSLVERAEAWSRENGYTRLALDVFASNRRAQRFYEKAGFQPETVRVIKRLADEGIKN